MTMLGRVLAVLSILAIVSCQIAKQGNAGYKIPEKGRMVGVDTVHDVKIDKDTVIGHNTLQQRNNRDKLQAHHYQNDEEREPDWSYNSFPEEVVSHVTLFKRNMTECLKEVQANDKRPIRRLSPKPAHESPVHGECLIACVLKKNGVIEGSKINKANLISLVSKFYAKDTKLMKKLEKNIDRCIEMSTRTKDECTLASQLNECTNDLMANNKHKIVVNY